MRMIILKGATIKQSRRNKEFGFWITISLLVCLIAGLGAYITSTYLANPVSSAGPGGGVQPTLSLQGPVSASIQQGQTLILHGEHFKANDPILFLLDSTFPIKDKNNQVISIRASSRGGFDVSILIRGPGWSANSHYIQGVDNLTRQNAYLTVVVSPASIPETTSKNLTLSMQDQTVQALTFQAVAGQGNPDQQRVAIANISGAPLRWTATANADHGLSWLVINENHVAGKLGIDGADSIGVSALITGLKSNQQANPYTGQIVFTINGREQLILPVELQVVDARSEIVFTPNPAVAALGPGNTCQATTFTLINLGNAFMNWTLVPGDSNAQNHIQFLANGRSVTQGELASAGMAGDTQTLNLWCNGVSAGDSYRFTMYIANTSWPVGITIQA